jgi:hypothetical protein
MDKAKDDPSGDYIFWKQLLQEASTRKVPTVLITDDRKEDWYWRIHGKTIGPRYELREEMASVAGVSFLIMSTETFLLHAKEYLQVSVSRATVDQAKEIQEALDRSRRETEEQILAQLAAEERMLQRASEEAASDHARMQAQIDSLTEQIARYRAPGNESELGRLHARRDYMLRELDAAEGRLSETQHRMAYLHDRLGELAKSSARLRHLGLASQSVTVGS